jgi:hypothetical protein
MRIFNRVQPVHKAVTGFGAMAHRILRGSTWDVGISPVYFGNLAVICRFRTAVSGCAYLANSASGKGFGMI